MHSYAQLQAAAGRRIAVPAGSPLDAYTTGLTGAWSMGRDLLTSFAGGSRYTNVSGAASAFNDQTGNARHFTQGTAANRPTITTAGPNSKDCIDFDGTNDTMISNAISDFITVSTGYGICSVYIDAIDTDAADSVWYNNDPIWGSTGQQIGVHLKQTGPFAKGVHYDGTGDVASASISIGAVQVIEWRHQSGNVYIRTADGSWSAGTLSNNTNSLASNLSLGYVNTAPRYDGKLFEFAIWNAIPSDMDAIRAAFKTWVGA